MTTVPLNDIRPGDLLLHASRGEISKLIQWVSDSDYSHVAFVYEAGLASEAASGGVRYTVPLKERIEDKGQHFHRIDVARPASPDPIPPNDLTALQKSAKNLQNGKFALNQMFELGLICVVKNKVPRDTLTKMLLTWILNDLISKDKDRLVCSEYIFRAFEGSGIARLTPVIKVSRPRPGRPFPSIDWYALWKEYEGASHTEPPAVASEILRLARLERVDDDVAANVDMSYRKALEDTQSLLRQVYFIKDPPANPELVLPEDFKESPSFKLLGTAVP